MSSNVNVKTILRVCLFVTKIFFTASKDLFVAWVMIKLIFSDYLFMCDNDFIIGTVFLRFNLTKVNNAYYRDHEYYGILCTKTIVYQLILYTGVILVTLRHVRGRTAHVLTKTHRTSHATSTFHTNHPPPALQKS